MLHKYTCQCARGPCVSLSWNAKVDLNEQMSSGVAEVYDNLLCVLCVAGDAEEMLCCTQALNCYSISH